MIIPKHIAPLPLVYQWRLMISIAIDSGRNNTVGGDCYSAHQAVSKFAEHNIDMVSCVHRKCQTRTGVSGDVKAKSIMAKSFQEKIYCHSF